MEYPEEIYFEGDCGLLMTTDQRKGVAGAARRRTYNIGCARGYQSGYEAGKAEQPDPLEGYSNLTAAISAGDPIDWEKLDGLNARCVNPELGMLTHKMERDAPYAIDRCGGWAIYHPGDVWPLAFQDAWHGESDWSLWIEGEVPLVRKTADQLEVGTYFLGKAWGDDPYLAYVGHPLAIDRVKTIYYAPEMLKAIAPASEWEVIEEYGTFQKPEGK